MKISTKGRYALRLMIDVAVHGGEEFVSLKDVAARQGISMKYLEQIAGLLGKAGFLRSGRGALGGYRLTKAPEEYTLGSILRLTEGNLAPVACLEAEENAPQGALKIAIYDEDDLYTFAENQYAVKDALCLWTDVPELLEQALRLYQGRAFWDGTGELEAAFLQEMARKYGLVLL